MRAGTQHTVAGTAPLELAVRHGRVDTVEYLCGVLCLDESTAAGWVSKAAAVAAVLATHVPASQPPPQPQVQDGF